MKRIIVFGGVFFVAILLTVVGAMSARQTSQTAKPPAKQGTAPAAAAQKMPAEIHGLDLSDFDRTCKPCEDFYHFVNGGWLAHNEIPAAYPAWGRVNILAEHNRDVLHEILEEAAANKANVPGSIDQKIGDYYATCMDTAKIDAAGIHPLDDEFARIAKISDVAALEAEVARLQTMGVHAMFNFGSLQDFKDSTEQTGGAFQGGIGMPDRDYYTKTDDASVKLRDAYQAHVVKMFGLMGDSDDRSKTEAATVMAIETKLAAASMTRVEQRDPEKIYHRMGLDELAAMTPHFSWPAYFGAIGFPGIRVVNAAQPDFFKALDAQLTADSARGLENISALASGARERRRI